MAGSELQLKLAVRHLRRGGIVAHASEGVWGLACDPYDPAAVRRLLALKRRAPAKGLILVADRADALLPLLAPLDEAARARMTALWPGPVTWVVPCRPEVPAWIRGRHRTLAVRVPGHAQLRALAAAFGRPLVSTSANPTGRPPARSALRVRAYFGRALDHLLPGELGGREGPSEIRVLAGERVLRGGGERARRPEPPDASGGRRFAVFGHPVAHSLSPEIHARFAAQRGERVDYRAVDVEPAAFERTVLTFFRCGGRGANVTVPHKAAAAALADRLDPRARRAGAVNTLAPEADDTLVGYNTDGPGLVRDIEVNLGVPLEGRRVVLLGAGGAAAGVVEALLDARPGTLVIANRTVSRARALAWRFAGPATVISARPFAALDRADVLINATAASLHGEVPGLPAAVAGTHTLCYDMVYGREETAFLAWCRGQGAERLADGLGMLVEQAALAFELWWGWRPRTAPVRAALRPDAGGERAAASGEAST